MASSSHVSGGGTSDIIGMTDTQESNICQDASVISPALADQGIASDNRVSDTAECASPTGRNILAEFSDTDSSV